MREILVNNPGMVTALIGAGVFLFISMVGAVLLIGRARRRVQDRISRVNPGEDKKRKKIDLAAKAKEMRLRKTESRTDQIAKNLLPNPAKLREKLERTGKGTSLGAYFLGSILAGLLTFIVLKELAALTMMASAAGGLVGAIILPYLYLGRVISKRTKRFVKLFPDAIDLMVRGVKAGLPVTESFGLVATEMDSPISDEFSRVVDAIKVGRDVDEALWEVEKRLQLPEWRFFIVSLGIQRETGGNLADTLTNLADVLRKRQQIRLKVKAYSSEARAGAWILGALPFAMFGIIYTLNRPYVMQLFNDDRGIFLIGAAGGSLLLGIFVMAKMIKFEI